MKKKKINKINLKYNGRFKTSTIKNSIHVDLFRWFNNPAIKTYAYSAKYKKSSLNENKAEKFNNRM